MNTLTYLPLVEQLSSRVIRILGCNPGMRTLQGTNTYLVGQGNKLVYNSDLFDKNTWELDFETNHRRILIDSSGPSDYSPVSSENSAVSNSEESVNKYVDALGQELTKQCCNLQEILITHWHPDHTGGVQTILKKLTQQPIRVSKHKLVDQIEFDRVTKYNYVEDEHVFKTEGVTIRAFFTPGHSQDHLCFYLEEENSLFSGSCLHLRDDELVYSLSMLSKAIVY